MLSGLRRYPVIAAQRAPLLNFMLDGLRDAGCRVIYVSDPRAAPYVITFETRDGERMGVVAYAFTATRTPTTNRPDDERSFQIKYGSKENFAVNEHEIWKDPLGLFTTIFLGIDSDEGFFVAADPEMHNRNRGKTVGNQAGVARFRTSPGNGGMAVTSETASLSPR